MKLPHTTYKASQFSWKDNAGVTEASDLRCPAGQLPGSRIWDDAADWGFTVIGKYSNVQFFYTDNAKSGDEVTGFRYHSACGKFSILIIND